MKTAMTIGAVAASLVLAGCGGDGGSESASSSQVGTFIDSPVSGLEFVSGETVTPAARVP